MSYVIIGPDGQHLGIIAQVPILTPLKEGERLSVQEVFAHLSSSFQCRIGDTVGEIKTGSMPHQTILTVVGTNIRIVEAVRRILLEHMGMTDISPAKLALPDLSGRWERVKFLIHWIWNG